MKLARPGIVRTVEQRLVVFRVGEHREIKTVTQQLNKPDSRINKTVTHQGAVDCLEGFDGKLFVNRVIKPLGDWPQARAFLPMVYSSDGDSPRT
jgi:hypothetical protein